MSGTATTDPAAPSAASPGYHCTICLGVEGEVVQKGCCCRNDAGAVHLACLIEHAVFAAENRDEWTAWYTCTTCGSHFTGDTQMGMVEAWIQMAEALGDDDVLVTAKSSYAIALSDRGRLVEAKDTAVEVYEVTAALHGPEAKPTLITKGNLAVAYSRLEQYARSIEMYRELLEVQKRLFGPEEAISLMTAEALACDMGSHGANAESAEILADVLATRKRVQGPDHPSCLGTMYNLAVTYMDDHQCEKAEPIMEELVPLAKRVMGEAHPNALKIAAKAAELQLQLGHLEEAAAMASRTIAKMKLSFAANDRYMAGLMITHGDALSRLGKHAEAEVALREARTILETGVGPEAPVTLRSASTLGDVLVRAGRRDEGMTLLKETHAVQVRVLGAEHWATLNTVARMKQWSEESSSSAP